MALDSTTGSICIRHGARVYCLQFAGHGWMAAELVQYLDDIYRDPTAETAILKLLGYTLQVTAEPLPRTADHWVELDLESRRLVTNSDLIRKAVKRRQPAAGDPFARRSLERIFSVLDQLDFTVELVG